MNYYYIFYTIWLSIFAVLSKTELCTEGVSANEIPYGMPAQILNVFGHLFSTIPCDNRTVREEGVRFLLYNREHKDEPIVLNPRNPVELNPNKPIKVLAPGWTCNVSNDRMPQLKDAYLRRYDCNVLGIDWSNISMDLYGSALCHSPYVASVVGKFLCNIGANMDVDLSKVHVLGHSMGGHLAGFIGKETQRQCGIKLGRVTGLDPAGPLYNLAPPAERLYQTDALFVDVIHTNMGIMGYYGPMGTVDFYPNCGTFQRGCGEYGLVKRAGCDHFRAADYMIESINGRNFRAKSCITCPGLPFIGPCISHMVTRSYTIMGENSPPNPRHRHYILV